MATLLCIVPPYYQSPTADEDTTKVWALGKFKEICLRRFATKTFQPGHNHQSRLLKLLEN